MPKYELFEANEFKHAAHLLQKGLSNPAVTPFIDALLFGHLARLEIYISRAKRLDVLCGDVSSLEPATIEHAANWFEHPGLLHATLVESGILRPGAASSKIVSDLIQSGVLPDNPQAMSLMGWPDGAPYFVKRKIRKHDTKTSPTLFDDPEADISSFTGSALVDQRAPAVDTESETESEAERKATVKTARCTAASETQPSPAAKTCLAKLLQGMSQQSKISSSDIRSPTPLAIEIILHEVGIEDEGFRRAVSRRVGRDRVRWRHLLELCAVLHQRRATIENPGGWLRTTLAARGVNV